MKKVQLDNVLIEIYENEIAVTTDIIYYSTARDRFDLLNNELFTANFNLKLTSSEFAKLKEFFNF